MRRLPLTLLFLVLIGVLAACALVLRQRNLALHLELARMQEQERLQSRLRAEHERLSALQVSSGEWQRLLDLHHEAMATGQAISALKMTLAQRKGLTPTAESVPLHENKLPLTGPRRTADEWVFAGTSSPLATFESFVWSATRGEPDKMASLLTFAAEDRARLETLYAGLSEAERNQYGSPEKLAATLIAVQVPQDLSVFGVVADLKTNTGEVAIDVRLQQGQAAERDLSFQFRQTNGAWQLIVPASVVSNFSRALDTAHAAAAPKS